VRGRTSTPALDGWLQVIKTARARLLDAGRTLGDFRDRPACAQSLRKIAQDLLTASNEMTLPHVPAEED
jgi:hypothetical protein